MIDKVLIDHNTVGFHKEGRQPQYVVCTRMTGEIHGAIWWAQRGFVSILDVGPWISHESAGDDMLILNKPHDSVEFINSRGEPFYE